MIDVPPMAKSLLSFSPENTQNSAAQGWAKAGLEGSAEVTLKVGRCLLSTDTHRKAHISLPFLLGKKLIDLTRRNFEAQN